jgi:UDP-N-acetylmuramoyl-L-alanyl-D-glutamate--2,6-diaminopimelate ligase
VAISGHTVDGHDYINKAIEAGATKVVVEKDVEASVPIEKVESTKNYVNKVLVEEYSKPLDDLTIIGVTGTNGKTTTCYLTYQMLKELGINAAYIGTIGFYYGDEKRELPNTTPDILSLYKLFYEAIEHGCTHVVMEVSSHSLEEKRIEGLHYDVAAFTNLTQDHLDFHKTMENYLKAKAKIMNYIVPNGTMIVNNDDEHSEAFRKDGIGVIKIGFKEDSGIKFEDAHFTPVGTNIKFKELGEDLEINTNLTSKFNVYNYMTCYAILRALGYSYEQIKEATPNVYPPSGRCRQAELLSV